jgi:hypothetical protein
LHGHGVEVDGCIAWTKWEGIYPGINANEDIKIIEKRPCFVALLCSKLAVSQATFHAFSTFAAQVRVSSLLVISLHINFGNTVAKSSKGIIPNQEFISRHAILHLQH